jgi:hypothetical protein
MTREDRQEVARFALVKGIEVKMAALIWHAVLGYLRWKWGRRERRYMPLPTQASMTKGPKY